MKDQCNFHPLQIYRSRGSHHIGAGKRAAARPYPTDASEAEVERMEAAIEVIAELQLTAEQLKVLS